jgi:hypothetical protein
MISTNVLAEWTRVGSSNDVDMTIYVDYEKIKKKGNKAKIWVLMDYKTIQKLENISHLSDVGLEECDCEEETKQTIGYYQYSGNMGSGGVVYSNTSKSKSIPIPPDSVSEIFLHIACSK